MFGRKKGPAQAAKEALSTITPYADRLANDDKLRRRLAGAIGATLAAQERARRQAGIAGIATRLGTDPVLRAQLADALSHLSKAKGRIERKRSHTVRNLLVLAVGVGAAAVAARKLFASDEPGFDGYAGEWRTETKDAEPNAAPN
jgi:hypothetical protein